MVEPAVASVMVTVCADVNVPVAGEITGVAAGGCVEPLEEYVHETICCVAVCPPVPPVKPTRAAVPPTVPGISMVQEFVKVALVTVSVMVMVSVVPL